MKQIVVSGPFDDLRLRDVRFLEEASRLGELDVLLWSDEFVANFVGKPPKFPLAERLYLIQAIRFVNDVRIVTAVEDFSSAVADPGSTIWALTDSQPHVAQTMGLETRVMDSALLKKIPETQARTSASNRKKVLVTGCYDWFHSGHVRFFEEASAHGDLYVVVGHDANIRLLKGEGHPLHPEAERRYLVGSARFVTQALISSGNGWLDAEPEIACIKPDIYAVNEDGDKGGKREFCEKNGIEYLVLKRAPAPGLPKRTSTDLRGF